MHDSSRRDVLGALVLLTGCGGASAVTAPTGAPAEPRGGGPGCAQENEVLPVEDLMREHGLLRRVLLVYRECLRLIEQGSDLAPETLTRAADVVKRFVEDYHERLEEDHLFPRFQKAGELVPLTQVLVAQHQAGRRITGRLLATTLATLKDPAGKRALAADLNAFVRMYEPHAAREDTVLFPALHRIVSFHEYDAMGEEFEGLETKMFGEGGFEKMVAQVAELERALGIEDLARFTPG